MHQNARFCNRNFTIFPRALPLNPHAEEGLYGAPPDALPPSALPPSIVHPGMEKYKVGRLNPITDVLL